MKKTFTLFKIEEITIPNPDDSEGWLSFRNHIEWSTGHETFQDAESILEDIFINEPIKHMHSVFTILPIFERQ